MTSSNDPPGGPAGQPGKRRPPTIDLKATEVGSVSAGAADAGSSPASEQPQGAAKEATASTSSASEPPRTGPAASALPPSLLWSLAAAGAGGALVTLAILALSGLFSNRDDATMVVDTRLARVEQQMRELAAKPLPVTGDTKSVDDLAGRLARLETQAATPRPPATDTTLANRIATLEGELKALGERIGVLGRRNDEIASIAGEARTRSDSATAAVSELKKSQAAAAPVVPRADIDALTSRIAALEQAAKALEAQLGARAAGDGTDRPLRLVVVASALNAAVERGTPFATELGAARAAASDPKMLAALEPFAKAGVPTVDALARELTALAPALAKAIGTASRDGGILDRLKANAERIVRVRPIDEAAGDDPITVVQRIETRAEQRNLAGAVAEIAKLPEPARALTKEWVAKVEARNAAVEASRRFAADALAAIGKPSL
jgi:hypothetical protein